MPSEIKLHTANSAKLTRLIAALDAIRNQALAQESELAAAIAAADPHLRLSARNLAHYFALRNSDIRAMQAELAELGLSSLGRSEAHTLATINAVRAILYALRDQTPLTPTDQEPLSFEKGKSLLVENPRTLLGLEPREHQARIMVTLPDEAAEDFALVRQLVEAGMNVARINCAHTDAPAWEKMVQNVRLAEQELECDCKILMDLAGPKIRTGPLEPGPKGIKSRPRRDLEGKVVAPARVIFAPKSEIINTELENTIIVPVESEWAHEVRQDDEIRFTDTRGRRRTLKVVTATDRAILAEGTRTSYFKTGMRLRVKRYNSEGKRRSDEWLTVGELSEQPNSIVLKRGDMLVLARDGVGVPARTTPTGEVIEPARIACTLPEVADALRPGDRVKFDDGKIEGVVRRVQAEGALIEITLAADKGGKLGSEKGINVPDTELPLRGLTEEDCANLELAAAHADIVALSFVNSAQDVADLQAILQARRVKHLGVLVKIETRRGFENLPRILLQLMRTWPAGVMIARGDLAVEMGWERMAEVQEEILWLCEAAHLPTVWATQVLEQLAKTGLPSRAEITDAAMAQRAECVMLNKGPHILDAIATLSNILKRMQGHQTKKTPLLRSLRVTSGIAEGNIGSSF